MQPKRNQTYTNFGQLVEVLKSGGMGKTLVERGNIKLQWASWCAYQRLPAKYLKRSTARKMTETLSSGLTLTAAHHGNLISGET